MRLFSLICIFSLLAGGCSLSFVPVSNPGEPSIVVQTVENEPISLQTSDGEAAVECQPREEGGSNFRAGFFTNGKWQFPFASYDTENCDATRLLAWFTEIVGKLADALADNDLVGGNAYTLKAELEALSKLP